MVAAYIVDSKTVHLVLELSYFLHNFVEEMLVQAHIIM